MTNNAIAALRLQEERRSNLENEKLKAREISTKEEANEVARGKEKRGVIADAIGKYLPAAVGGYLTGGPVGAGLAVANVAGSRLRETIAKQNHGGSNNTNQGKGGRK